MSSAETLMMHCPGRRARQQNAGQTFAPRFKIQFPFLFLARSMAEKRKIRKKWTNILIPGSFSSPSYFYKGLRETKDTEGKTQEEIKKLLERDISFQASRALRKKFPRRKDLSYFFSERWEADVGDIGKARFIDLTTGKEKGRYFLLVVDLFSKKVFVEPLANKSAPSVQRALENIISGLHQPYSPPQTLESDQGGEFFNSTLRRFLQKKSVDLVFARGANKARNAERYIRSFKRVLIPFLETHPNQSWDRAVRAVGAALNRRFNRSLGTSPNQVVINWKQIQEKNLKERPVQPFLPFMKEQLLIEKGRPVRERNRTFALGDAVIIPRKRRGMKKESDRQFGYEVYFIKTIRTEEKPYMYKLEDGLGTKVKRLFYAQELRKVEAPSHYPVHKIVRTKMVHGKKFALVSWLDHDSRFNSWIPASQVE